MDEVEHALAPVSQRDRKHLDKTARRKSSSPSIGEDCALVWTPMVQCVGHRLQHALTRLASN
jgi:hypothetical protein